LAVANINAAGGVNGEDVVVVGYDAQSELSKYTQFAQATVLCDGIVAMFAGLTSSSREAILPIFREANIPYFYSSLYEGDACDRQTFMAGSSASQQLSVLIEWAIENYGRKTYIMALTIISAKLRAIGFTNTLRKTVSKLWAKTIWLSR
jgi:branched-chain amino acid transport system substrate-binding protein